MYLPKNCINSEIAYFLSSPLFRYIEYLWLHWIIIPSIPLNIFFLKLTDLSDSIDKSPSYDQIGSLTGKF